MPGMSYELYRFNKPSIEAGKGAGMIEWTPWDPESNYRPPDGSYLVLWCGSAEGGSWPELAQYSAEHDMVNCNLGWAIPWRGRATEWIQVWAFAELREPPGLHLRPMKWP